MTWIRRYSAAAHWVAPAVLVLALSAAPPVAAASEDSDEIVRLAMSTASVLMMAEHEHEIEEALEKGDFDEALEEAEELVPWMKGAAWHEALMEPVHMSSAALDALIVQIKAKDQTGAEAAFAEVEKHFHHLHHELMELVGEGHGH